MTHIATRRAGASVLPMLPELSWLVLGLAILLAGAETGAIARIDDWWSDELYTLWATTPSVPFAQAFAERIGIDPTPPLYYLVVLGVRRLVEAPLAGLRTELLLVNAILFAAAASTVLLLARNTRLAALSRATVAAVLLSGPVLAFLPEGRAYAMAMAVVFVAAWCAAAAIAGVNRRVDRACLAACGLLAGFVHLYAAIACGALGAAMVLLAVSDRRRDLMMPGLVVGGAACASTAAFLLLMQGGSEFVAQGWTDYAVATVRTALWEVRQLEVGGYGAAVLLLAVLALGLWQPRSRPFAVALACATALLAAIPLAVSFKVPIISGRYWLVGAPCLPVFLAFAAQACWQDARARRPRAAACIAGTVLFLAAASASGYANAYARTENKPGWKGAALVRSLASACPAGSIHTLDSVETYSQIMPANPDAFMDGSDAATPELAAGQGRCPVLGYAEHVLRGDGFVTAATEAELLAPLKITAAPGEVRIVRHSSGYVVLRAAPPD